VRMNISPNQEVAALPLTRSAKPEIRDTP
jgi:hypothetical protein